MLKNYISIAVRSLLKYKAYSFINVIGLAVGIACTLVILLYVQDELSYDKYHEKSERTYRIIQDIEPVERSASVPVPLRDAIVNDYPHLVDDAVRFFTFQNNTQAMEYLIEGGDKLQFNEPNAFLVDSTVFNIFDWEIVKGDAENPLSAPLSLVITESTAQRYFGDEEAVGKIIRWNGGADLNVTAVMKDIPKNSHFKIDMLISMTTIQQALNGFLNQNWYWNPAWTYITLKEGVKPEQLEEQFPAFIDKYFTNVSYGPASSLMLQPLTDIHLYSHRDYEITTNSDVSLVYIFSIIAFMILLIAGINFVNLATARSIKRAKEVGVRKVLGAEKSQLIRQFLAESVLVSIVAIIVALPLIYLILPFVNGIAQKELSVNLFGNFVLWGGIIISVLLVGFASGMYPALFLSSFQPVKVLGGKVERMGGGSLLRKALVVGQFTVSIILIVGTIITFNQLSHLRTANLGFDQEHVIVVPVQGANFVFQGRFLQFRDQLLQHKNISSVSAANMIAGTETQTSNYVLEGKTEEEAEMFNTYFVHHDFVKTMGVNVLAGRGFDYEYAAADTAAIVINETLMRYWGYDNPEEVLNRRISGTIEGNMRVIGVIEDFHFKSLREPIGNFVLTSRAQNRNFFVNYVYVRVQPQNVQETLGFMEQTLASFAPERAFDYFFLDERIDRLYQAEDALGKISTFFAIMAIVIACLGLFGLSAFTAEQKTKEIGIRKVVGASTGNIVILLSKQFLKLIVVANLIAWPTAYYVMNMWLQDFSTRIEINFIPFVLAAVFTFLIAFFTMSFQAIKAAHVDPVKSLKYE